MGDDAARLPPWRQGLARALHRNRAARAARYLQLANVDLDRRPANRTVVFRGFDDCSRVLVATDARSNKMRSLRSSPAVALCWYFAKTREQFRLDGEAQVLDANGAADDDGSTRECLWQTLSDSARAQFLWPSPGAPFEAQGDVQARFPTALQAQDPPPSFLVLRVSLSAVDHLELRPTPQARTRFDLADDGRWVQLSVNP